MKICTDTAAIVIYDIACLKHRLRDRCDWWSSRYQELEEINKGNALFIGLGSDGCYNVNITDSIPGPDISFLTAVIRNTSGQIFIGPAEEVTGDEYEPDGEDGSFIAIPQGNKKVIAWEESGNLMINIRHTHALAINEFSVSPKIA